MSRDRGRQQAAASKPLREAKALASNLSRILDDFVTGHHELMQTAKFITDQEDALDSSATQVEQAISRVFPDLDAVVMKQALDIINPTFENLFSSDPPTNEEQQEQRNAEVREAVNALFKGLETVLPAGHTYPCLAAAVETFSSRGHSHRLRASLLIGLVAEFEVLISNLFGEIFRFKPAQAISKERTFNWEFIASQDDLDAMKDRIVDDAVMAMMYSSYMTWLDKLQTFGVTVPVIARADDTKEVFQRRHVIVHNGGRVSSAYLSKVETEPKPRLDSVLTVSADYLARAADNLLAVGVALLTEATRMLLRSEDDRKPVDTKISKRIYELLQHRRFQVIVSIVELIDVERLTGEFEPLNCKVNYWLALKRLERFSECRADVEEWDVSDVPQRFRLARLALLDELEEGLKLTDEIRNTPEMSIESWVTWPVLDELRKADSLRAPVLEVDVVERPKMG